MDTQKLIKKNILSDIHNFPEKLSISKVVLFFERKEVHFTKTMIQNYVRIGLLPELYNKRYYLKKHLVFLALTDCLKNIFSLDELKLIYMPLYNLEDDNYFLKLFEMFITNYNNAFEDESKRFNQFLKNKNSFDNIDISTTLIYISAKTNAIKDFVLHNIPT